MRKPLVISNSRSRTVRSTSLYILQTVWKKYKTYSLWSVFGVYEWQAIKHDKQKSPISLVGEKGVRMALKRVIMDATNTYLLFRWPIPNMLCKTVSDG